MIDFDWLIDWLIDQLIKWLIDWLIDWLIQFSIRYDHPHIIAGQGTICLEIIEQISDLDIVVVQVGVGGMIDPSFNWFWLNDWFWLTNWLNDWLIDWIFHQVWPSAHHSRTGHHWFGNNWADLWSWCCGSTSRRRGYDCWNSPGNKDSFTKDANYCKYTVENVGLALLTLGKKILWKGIEILTWSFNCKAAYISTAAAAVLQ